MRKALVLAMATSLVGCASSSNDITPNYVSPVIYQNFNCQQLGLEAQRVSAEAAKTAGVQDQKRQKDQVWTTVGAVIFWPALLAVKGDGATAAELGNLKGHMRAIEQTSIQKKCGIKFEKAPVKKKTTPAKQTTAFSSD